MRCLASSSDDDSKTCMTKEHAAVNAIGSNKTSMMRSNSSRSNFASPGTDCFQPTAAFNENHNDCMNHPRGDALWMDARGLLTQAALLLRLLLEARLAVSPTSFCSVFLATCKKTRIRKPECPNPASLRSAFMRSYAKARHKHPRSPRREHERGVQACFCFSAVSFWRAVLSAASMAPQGTKQGNKADIHTIKGEIFDDGLTRCCPRTLCSQRIHLCCLVLGLLLP